MEQAALIDSMLKSAISHKATLDTFRRDVKDNTIQIAEKSKRLEELNELTRVTDWSCNYLDTLIKEESGKFIKRLNELLDYAIKTIFDDCDYSVEIRVSDNSRATIHLVYDDAEGNHLEPDIQQCGGGIRSAIGSILQVFFILHYRTEKILLVDEGFSQISSRYLDNFFGFLEELATKNGLKVLLITHDERFLSYANACYEVKNGKATLVESRQKGDSADGSDSADITA